MNFFLLIRSCIFYAVYTFVTLLFGLYLLLFQHIFSNNQNTRVLSLWTFYVIWALRFICGIRFKVNGRENIPNDLFIALSNHQSQWETYYLVHLLKPVSVVLKQELLNIPVFGWCLSKMNPIAIDRSNPKEALKSIQTKGLKHLNEDRFRVLIFPEGTRQPCGQLGKFARSGAQLAIRSQYPVIAISHNAGHCWIPGKLIKKPGLITINISPVIPSDEKNASKLTQEVKGWIEQNQP